MGVLVRRLETADADRLVRCFERCYGRSYPREEVYDASSLARLVESGALRSVVAVADDGAVVGHIGLSAGRDGASVVEAGYTVVDPAFRGTGVLAELSKALYLLCATERLAGFVHYPTTAHEVMQKTSIRFGGVETGIMLAYVPGDTEYVDVEVGQADGRVAATVVFQPVAGLTERAVTLPARYAEPLMELYALIGAQRSQVAHRSPSGASSFRTANHPRRGLLHFSVDRIGADLAPRVAAETEAHAASVAQIDLSLGDPGVGDAADQLAEIGFFYCALLPEFGASDVLRLQRLADQPRSAYEPVLANDAARGLLARMNDERVRPTAG